MSENRGEGWDFPPLNNLGDAVVPLLAGNSILLKPSPHMPLSARRTQIAVARSRTSRRRLPGGRRRCRSRTACIHRLTPDKGRFPTVDGGNFEYAADTCPPT
jgi:hypothetical protein